MPVNQKEFFLIEPGLTPKSKLFIFRSLLNSLTIISKPISEISKDFTGFTTNIIRTEPTLRKKR